MTYKPNEDIQIDKNDIFKHDMLKRESEVVHMSDVIQNFTQQTVLSIDSEWGTGKTVFVKLLQAHLESKEIKTIYFNAWNNDSSIDPLVAITNEIIHALNISDKDKKELIEFASFIFHTTLKGVDFTLLSGIPILQWLSKTFLKSFFEELFNRVKERKTKETKFKDKLSEYIQKNEQKPLVIFIDELDRCRPTFAVETLERIKHLFNIDGIVFVVSINLEQLRHSVSVIYGNEFNSYKYLERFIDLSYSIENPDVSDYWSMLVNQSENLKNIERHGLYLINCFNLSLRDINRYFYRLNLTFNNKKEGDNEGLLALLVMLQYTDKNIYQSFCNITLKGIEQVEGMLDFHTIRFDLYDLPNVDYRDNDISEFYCNLIYEMKEKNILLEFPPSSEITSRVQDLQNRTYNYYDITQKNIIFNQDPSFFQDHVRTVNLFSRFNDLGNIEIADGTQMEVNLTV